MIAITRQNLVLTSSFLLGVGLIINPAQSALISSLGFALLSYSVTYVLIPRLGPSFVKIGLFGKDLSKKNNPVLPETMGAISAIVYLFTMYFFIPFMFYKYLVTITSGGGNRDEGLELTDPVLSSSNSTDIPVISASRLFPHNKLATYLSAILCLQSMFVLGVADDLFDIRWRNKFFLPAIASIPLLIVYYVDFGVTKVMVPAILQVYLGETVDLGLLYYGYMAAVAIFCTNCINIYAGVNGLEVGQSIVIALLILANDTLYLINPGHPAIESHLFSMYLLLPFLGVSFALLRYNWWPAKCFVGDTYCYFAGMVFAVVGILGHFSKTLLLFFIPQIFNFVYSVPQLFGLVVCPRHRMPRFNAKTGLLEVSRADLVAPPAKWLDFLLRILAKLRLIAIWTKPDDDKVIVQVSNMTAINLCLVNMGPLREDRLTMVLMAVQLFTGVVAIVLRHSLASVIFGKDNL
ncbi:hypothetical protein NADFUDRAFT_82692 [Nadsonia fulvescens var. elongata DSM 6958]|uniref:UDP-N-acetylglucosamine--dolichyl-phosphate N-acetylglucosaminephosphotransferase n=1 Tax=Nadsonia fulvescens var. elongata DSM 6958 TaxID=857566 RepID=A0A1E3PLJ9_9ASCO|nr:hypothetical protein NADFUDRAFT_82692 [Nadsonia fulvescens var. elongata DSM 6958]